MNHGLQSFCPNLELCILAIKTIEAPKSLYEIMFNE